MTRIYLPTLREVPAEAEVVSHRLMLRAGMIRKAASGIYTWLPLGLRVLRKVQRIVREEMDRAGAQEIFMPMVQPAELWIESGRWDAYGPELLRIKDRRQRRFCLGPTHEEVITALVRDEIKSYRDLPKNLYQIQTKFRDEIRPRFGVMRSREFEMKDAYSFDADDQGAEKSYREMYRAYSRIFQRCGLKFMAVEALTGQIGGSFSHEFMVTADTGEDGIALCETGDYAANLEKAESLIEPRASEDEQKPVEKVETPGRHSVEEVADFLNLTPDRVAKTLIYETDRGPVAAMVRGDRELNEGKLMDIAEAAWIQLADDKTIEQHTGGPTGFSGPVGIKLPLYMDRELDAARNLVTGANEADCHLLNVNPGRDFKPEKVGDIKLVRESDPCPRCGRPMRITRGIEVGHVFKLGTKYSKAMNAVFLDESGKEQYLVMGCYGIGTGRTVAAAIEQNHDENGIIWPAPLAPYHVCLLPVNVNDDKVRQAAERLYDELCKAGLEVLYDDRDERAGVKFKDADLLGIPLRIVIGAKNLKSGKVEIKARAESEARLADLDRAAAEAEEYIKAALEGS